MNRGLGRLGVAEWCTWIACALALIGALSAVLVPGGGSNRVLGVAAPFVLGAAVLAANALPWQRPVWLDGILSAAAALALLYGLILGLSVPLRLAVQGTCPPQTASCPLGFEHPLTAGENFAVYALTLLGALALVFAFTAFEARHVRRTRPRQDLPEPPPP